MASASRATARMSSAAGLAAMRYSGSSRANFFFAGSSEGNGLSVMAMMVRAIGHSVWHRHRRACPGDLEIIGRAVPKYRDGRVKPAHDGDGLQGEHFYNTNTCGLTQFGNFRPSRKARI